MKFGHQYDAYLDKGKFPEHFVRCAISYRQLKKNIKHVKQELINRGLLRPLALQESVYRSNGGSSVEDDRPLRYEFSTASKLAYVIPKLLVLVDEDTGQPIDTSLPVEARDYIQRLALAEANNSVLSLFKSGPNSATDSACSHKSITVPLTTDSAFFTSLQKQLFELNALRDKEEKRLHSDITQVGTILNKATDHRDGNDKLAKKDMGQWRKLFELYLDSRVFFAATEQDHGAQDWMSAQERWRVFLCKASEQALMGKFKKTASGIARQDFLKINEDILQNIRFQEINQTAVNKILKKFDKQTALGAKRTFPNRVSPSMLMGTDMAIALAQQVTSEIKNVLPLAEDYICPICAEIAWRPVRLRCQHIYCIRCLITLQRSGKDNCPLCREPTVCEADSLNLDPALHNFLMKYFPDEVKAKMKINKKQALVDEFGPEVLEPVCTIM